MNHQKICRTSHVCPYPMFFLKTKVKVGYVPEEATFIDDPSTGDTNGAIANVIGGIVEAFETIGNREIVSTLKETISWVVTTYCLSCSKVFALVTNLIS